MPSCQECGSPLAEDARFCSRCGHPSGSASDLPTQADATPAVPPRTRSASSIDGRFPPGVILADRYRIVAALGRGGMGEVYRADDLKLGHPVALKFLPRAFEQDPRLLERFHAEVRNARQVSHPNVCRVYDIGEAAGQHFLTMEYIDGEDLASLLRRIGRLPADKAVEIAHQLCAGLAAAHDAGMLHRDLKPANVMLDGRGRARITDFGLAVTADEAGSRPEFAGTPAYMAPEQLAGAPATVKSDIYALGLVLFEIFTGKRAFDDNNLAAWATSDPDRESRAAARLPRPSGADDRASLTRTPVSSVDVDPAVQRAILRCLEKDPARRPESALQVSRALPGGDPLAAALAAGETPSPEMVAAAEPIEVSTRTAIALAAAIVALLLVLVPLARRSSVVGLAPPPKSAEALADRAGEIARRLGYENAADTYSWWAPPQQYLEYRAQHEPAPQWYRSLAGSVPHPLRFSYRQRPEALAPLSPLDNPDANDPPMTVAGEVKLTLDAAGRLLLFRAVPPKFEKDAPPASAPDWTPLFAAASLQVASFTPAEATDIPTMPFDARAAWQGEIGGMKYRVNAAAFRGKPVFFQVLGPWEEQTGPAPGQQPRQIVNIIVGILLLLALPALGLLLAIRNVRLGRGDTRGALRLTLFTLAATCGNFLLGSHFVASSATLLTIILGVGLALFISGIVWVSYMALEPLVRRQAPHLLIGWTRLLVGRFSDPRVGLDILVGVAAGLAIGFLNSLERALPYWFKVSAVPPFADMYGLAPLREFVAILLNQVWSSVYVPLSFLFLVAIVRLLTRRTWIAAAVLFAVLSLNMLTFPNKLVQVPLSVLGALLFVLVLLRFGLLAFSALILVQAITSMAVLDLRPGSWYFSRPLIMVLIVAALAVHGFRSALAGRKLFTALDEA